MNTLAALKASLQAEGRRRMTHRAPERFENPLPQLPLGLDHAALALSPVPIAGDIAGFAADAYDWYEHPENRSLGNALMVGAGLLPFVPPAAAGARVVGNSLMDAVGAGVAPGSLRSQAGAIAWHGTPHRFAPTERNPLGEFDASRIGTGEGAQAYGHGLYFAENPEVARAYRSGSAANPDITYKGESPTSWALGHRAQYDAMPTAERQALRYLADYKDISLARDAALENGRQEVADAIQKMAADIKPGSAGHLYRVDLPDERINSMLDWDNPLPADHPTRKLLSDLAEKKFSATEFGRERGQAKEAILAARNENLTGQGLYQQLARTVAKPGAFPEIMVPNKKAASQALRETGIPGIRYLDQGSRGAAQGTSNFVVFDPAIAKILGRE